MEEEIQLDPVPEGKVYKTGNIAVATFFGGVLVGAYLLAENFKTLGNLRAARLTWAIGVLLIILAIASPFLPVINQLPGLSFNILFTLMVAWAGRRYQLSAINQHIDNGGELYPSSRMVIVTLIGVGLILMVAFILFIVQDRFIGNKF